MTALRISGALISVAVLMLSATFTARAADGDNVVLEWNAIALRAIATAKAGTPAETQYMALVQVAVSDAMANTMASPAHRPFSVVLPKSSGGASPDAAVAAAAHAALVSLYPSQREQLDADLRESLDRIASLSFGPTQFAMPVWQLMQHAANHSAHHRGQVALMVRMLGHAPGDFDLLFYDAGR